jgi:dihydropteroate synthase
MKKYKLRRLYPESAYSELADIGFSLDYLNIAVDKYRYNLIKIHDIKSPAANILKQTALSKGADLGVSTKVVNCKVDTSDTILTATDKQLRLIIDSLNIQPYGLNILAKELQELLDNKYKNPSVLQIKKKDFCWGEKTYIMGVLNITPDSFSDPGKNLNLNDAMASARDMIDNGVDIIDVGAESTRPGAKEVDAEIQIERITPVLKELVKQFPDIPFSVDTRNHRVADKAIEIGASLINDVSGLMFDKELVRVVAATKVPIILMHSKDIPERMQEEASYENLMDELSESLLESVQVAREAGIEDNKIILDPGIGFGKKLYHNLEIIKRILEIKSLGYPLLVGASRKAFIGKILDNADVESREEGLAAINTYLINHKVDMLRVHNVKYHSKVIRMADKIVRTTF